MTSRIEQLIGRTLETETRAGVPHFKPGQLHAKRTDPAEAELVELSYVDGMGHAWLVLCMKAGGEWMRGGAMRGGQQTIGERTPPELTAEMIAALEAAE